MVLRDRIAGRHIAFYGFSRRFSTLCVFSLCVFPLCMVLSFASPTQAAGTRGLGVVGVTTQEGRRVQLYKGSHALLIGVSDYTAGWPDLEAIPAEMDSLQAALEKQGFSVTRVRNPDNRQIKRAFEDFIDEYGYDAENRLLFFYSGHGYTRKPGGRQKGYLVPANAPDPNQDEKGFLRKSLDMGLIQTWARSIEAKHALFLFDSCFSGTIFQTKALPTPRHITDSTTRPVRQFITAGSAGEEVPAQSVFLPSFIRAIEGEGDTNRDGYVTGTELGQFLRQRVMSYGKGQTPQFGKIKDPALDQGDFVFALKRARRAVVAAKPRPAGKSSVPLRTIDAEEESWRDVKEGNTILDYQDYLAEYPQGRFASIAKRRIRRQRRKAAPPRQGAGAAVMGRERAGDTWRDTVTGMEFVRVPGGSFGMGCHANAGECWEDEKPVRTVRLDGFWMGKQEVTQGQWKKVMGENPATHAKGDNYPVDSVSWDSVQEFIRKLNGQSSATFRLPSEAQWEYACRAGGKSVRFGTKTGRLTRGEANYGIEECCKGDNRDGHLNSAPVASFAPNRLGLYDMSGNLSEWVQDKEANYGELGGDNPLHDGSGGNRVFRGGSWFFDSRRARCTNRDRYPPTTKGSNMGFRLVRAR